MDEIVLETESLPEGIPEKFYDPEKKAIKVGALAKSYTELEGRQGKREDDLRAALLPEVEEAYVKKQREQVPETPNEYTITLDEGVGKGIELKADDPMVQWWRETAHALGVPQEKFNEAVNTFVSKTMKPPVDFEEEKKKLGANADDRISRVKNWISGNLSEGVAKTLEGMTGRASTVIAMEELIDKARGHRIDNGDSGNGDAGKMTREKVKAMMSDPRYRRDKAYTDNVLALWQRVSGG